MSLLKDLQKFVKLNNVLALVGLLFLVLFIYQYSDRKGTSFSGMTGTNNTVGYPSSSSQISPAMPSGQNESPSSVGGSDSGVAAFAQGSNRPVVNPEELLPKDTNSQWAQLNPRGNGELNNVNLLSAGYLTGINTIGSSLRNANLQLRSEPPNPQVQVSPWMNTTMEPDLMRVPLELGAVGGSQ